MADEESSEEEPQLSTETVNALKEFFQEQQEKDRPLIQIKGDSEHESLPDLKALSFDEDWQLSQFWYDEETAHTLAKVAVKVAGHQGNIALISCPTLYRHIKQLAPACSVSLLEYDRRFAAYGEDFIWYDYRAPLDVCRELASHFDLVVMDPPYLSEECLTKTAVTAKFLAKDMIILCSGAVMEDLARRLLDMRKCDFQPQHKNNLANEFFCYANFPMDQMLSLLQDESYPKC